MSNKEGFKVNVNDASRTRIVEQVDGAEVDITPPDPVEEEDTPPGQSGDSSAPDEKKNENEEVIADAIPA